MPDPVSASLPLLPFVSGKTSIVPITGSHPFKFFVFYTSLNSVERRLVDAFVAAHRRNTPWGTNNSRLLLSAQCYFDVDTVAWSLNKSMATAKVSCRVGDKQEPVPPAQKAE